MPAKLEKRNVKIIQLILAATSLGFKYRKVYLVTHTGFYNNNNLKDADIFSDLLMCITYFGLLFLKTMAVISTISGQIPKGNYVTYFHIFGSIAYAGSELIFIKEMAQEKAWAAVPILGNIISVLLIIMLLLDCFNVI